MQCEEHDWREIGLRRPHIEGGQFAPRPVTYVKCARCQWVGFRRNGSPVIYTWEQNEEGTQ